MEAGEYIMQKFQTFGITMSEADLLDIALSSGIAQTSEVTADNVAALSVGIARFIPSLFMRATSISESGFSMSWDMSGIKAYYAYLCRKYGLQDEINTDKPKVSFLQ